MKSLIWFRSDLRVDDNPALRQATRDSRRPVVAVFALTPDQWKRHDWGDARVDFLLRNLASLRDSLAELRIPLRIVSPGTFADVPDALMSLCRELSCTEICFNAEYEVNEWARDEAVTRKMKQAGIDVHVNHDQTVVMPDRLRTGAGGFYRVYTPFRKAWVRHVIEQQPIEPLAPPRKQPAQDTASDKVPDTVSGFADPGLADLWPAGEVEARLRLRAFLAGRVLNYRNDRDMPGKEGTSGLSAYLAVGAISARRCLAEAIRQNAGRVEQGEPGIDTWINELIWREFYRHVLVGFPRICRNRPFDLSTERIPWKHDQSRFDAWCAGRTGVPIVDAGMRQLTQTGWMHNRLRMVAAMYLTKDLFIDWRWGERWFMNRLIDGDFASNNGGWQWSASTGTDAAPYFRIFNPVSQSRRFDPYGTFIRRYCPELAGLEGDALHDPPPLVRASVDYPIAIVDHARARVEAIAAFKAVREAEV